jgi:hypothetical protein
MMIGLAQHHHGHHGYGGMMYPMIWPEPSPQVVYVTQADQSATPVSSDIIPGLSNTYLAVGVAALAGVYMLARRKSK